MPRNSLRRIWFVFRERPLLLELKYIQMKNKIKQNNVWDQKKKSTNKSFENKKKYVEKYLDKLNMPCTDCGGD